MTAINSRSREILQQILDSPYDISATELFRKLTLIRFLYETHDPLNGKESESKA